MTNNNANCLCLQKGRHAVFTVFNWVHQTINVWYLTFYEDAMCITMQLFYLGLLEDDNIRKLSLLIAMLKLIHNFFEKIIGTTNF